MIRSISAACDRCSVRISSRLGAPSIDVTSNATTALSCSTATAAVRCHCTAGPAAPSPEASCSVAGTSACSGSARSPSPEGAAGGGKSGSGASPSAGASASSSRGADGTPPSVASCPVCPCSSASSRSSSSSAALSSSQSSSISEISSTIWSSSPWFSRVASLPSAVGAANPRSKPPCASPSSLAVVATALCAASPSSPADGGACAGATGAPLSAANGARSLLASRFPAPSSDRLPMAATGAC
mmetsp:Transcript_125194/g.286869  ORF Transcript_125194/g.286869 Transcript_125194/m.286869 type:complete len:243 (+) Transcript_125194:520-1248(+)